MYVRSTPRLGQTPTQPIQPPPLAPMPTQPQVRSRSTWVALEAALRSFLNVRLRPEDARRIQIRRSLLIMLFLSLRATPWDADELYQRLTLRLPGDDLARLFHGRLATPTRRMLLGILGRIVRGTRQPL
jgi:hypothetical protein